MNLTSELPLWLIRDGLIRTYPCLEERTRCDALVIGGGISGALVAHELVRRGVDCVLIDRRDIGLGSTSASTALLQYEIDTPLSQLGRRVGTKSAERAYWLGIEAIHHLQGRAGNKCGFALRPSLQFAARRADVAGLKAEYRARKKIGLPVQWMEEEDLKRDGIRAPAALRSSIAAEVDPYCLTHRLLRLAVKKGLRVFDRTTALRYVHSPGRVTVDTDRQARIMCRGVFFATGYETQQVLQQKVVRLKSTYAFVSEPLRDLSWWKDRAVLWGTGNPYLYMRTTDDRRVLVGGEDDFVLNPQRRDRQLLAKTNRLMRRFRKIFPEVQLESAFPGLAHSAARRMVSAISEPIQTFQVDISRSDSAGMVSLSVKLQRISWLTSSRGVTIGIRRYFDSSDKPSTTAISLHGDHQSHARASDQNSSWIMRRRR